MPNIDQGDSGSNNILNENACPGLIALDGCCCSEASQLLNDRMSFRDYFLLGELPLRVGWGEKLPRRVGRFDNSSKGLTFLLDQFTLN